MAKGRHLSVLLLAPVLLLCDHPGRTDVGKTGSGVPATARENVKRIYTSQLGIREATGRNDGLRIKEYLRYTGLEEGYSWCAAFVCWVYGQAGVPNPRSPWSPALFPEDKLIWQRGSASLKGQPRTGDVFGIWFPDKKRIAHVGFVDRREDKYLITVEGNTNAPGDNDREGVFRKRRLRSSIYRVADFIGN